MFKSLFPVFLYEVNGAAGGGPAGGQAVAEPAAQAPTGAQGGAGEPNAAANENFWGMFPDVPETQRMILEPHLKNVQAHVTRMEQELAPFKAIAAAGVDAPTMQGLVGFSQRFEADPLGTWLEMGAALQDPTRNDGKPVVHDDLDFEMLAKIARGEAIEDPADQQQAQIPPQGQGTSPETQQLLQVIQGLQAEVADLKGQYTQDKTQAQTRANERVLVNTMGTIRTALEDGGFPKEKLTDDMIRSAIIVSKGNAAQAQKMLSDLHSGILEGGIQAPTPPGELKLNNGVPKAPPKPLNGRQPRDAFEASRAGAEDYLKRVNNAGRQG